MEELKKQCVKCRELKELNEFNKDKSNSTGFHRICKKCLQEDYLNNADKKREYQAKFRAKNRDSLRNRAKKYHEKHKDRENKKKKIYARTLNGRYTALKGMAKYRKKEFCITFEEYSKIVENKNCFYCDKSLPEAGHGLDRIDSSLGYTINNVVPSCKECNTIKMDTVSHTEMIEIAKLLKTLRKSY